MAFVGVPLSPRGVVLVAFFRLVLASWNRRGRSGPARPRCSLRAVENRYGVSDATAVGGAFGMRVGSGSARSPSASLRPIVRPPDHVLGPRGHRDGLESD